MRSVVYYKLVEIGIECTDVREFQGYVDTVHTAEHQEEHEEWVKVVYCLDILDALACAFFFLFRLFLDALVILTIIITD